MREIALLNHRLTGASDVVTDAFIQPVEPAPLSLEGVSRILMLAPHQDDEVIGAGGTLLLARDAGAEICVSFITDGAMKPDSRGLERFGSVEKYVAIRNAEAEKVCGELGATTHYLGIGNAKPKPTLDHLDQLSDLIHRFAPRVLMVPWLLDGAGKHRMVNHLLWLANRRRPLPDCQIWTYQISNTLMPNGFVDITDVIETKRALIEVYESQNTYSRRYDHQTIGLNAWNGRYIKNKDAAKKLWYLELFFTSTMAEHLDLVEEIYLSDLETIYAPGKSLTANMTALHRSVTAS